MAAVQLVIGQILPVIAAAVGLRDTLRQAVAVLVEGGLRFVVHLSAGIADVQDHVAAAVIAVFLYDLAVVVLAASGQFAVPVKGLLQRQLREILCHCIGAPLGGNAAAAVFIFIGGIAVGQQAELIVGLGCLIAVFVIGVMNVRYDGVVLHTGSHHPHQNGLRRFAGKERAAAATSAAAAASQTNGHQNGQQQSKYRLSCVLHQSFLLLP